MDSLSNLFSQLDSLDIKLWLEGERLRFDAPQGALNDALRTQLQASKADIIAYLQAKHLAQQNQARRYPFSFAQQHFWSLQQLNPKDSFYTVPFAFRIQGPLDSAILRDSFNAIVKRHEILRTTLQYDGSEYFQRVAASGEIDLQIIRTDDECLQNVIDHELTLPFDLSADPCLRVRLYELSENERVLLLCLHILIYDQRSLNALLGEISQHYNALIAGQLPKIPPLPLQYGDYAKEQQDLLKTPMAHRKAYWEQWFAQGEPKTWSWQTDCQKRAIDFEADILWQHFDESLAMKLRQLAQNNGVTLYMTLLAAYSVLLYRYTACPDVIIGTTFANRGKWQFDGLIGSTLSVLSLRIDLTTHPSWLNLLKQLRDQVAQAMAFQDIPFRAIMPVIQPERKKLTPLFQSILSFLAETAHNELRLADLDVKFLEHIANPSSRPDLYLTLWEKKDIRDSGLTGYWLPQKNLFSEIERSQVMQNFARLLTIMVQDPEQGIDHALNTL